MAWAVQHGYHRLVGARSIVITACLCVAAGPVIAVESARNIERSGAGGTELRVFTYTPHRADCSSVKDVRIIVRTSPAHGSVTTRPDTVIAGASRFGAADCSGRPIDGLGVYYVPQPGFHGIDRFDYDASFSNGTEHATVTVIIR